MRNTSAYQYETLPSAVCERKEGVQVRCVHERQSVSPVGQACILQFADLQLERGLIAAQAANSALGTAWDVIKHESGLNK